MDGISRSFDNPYAYQAAIRAVDVQVLVSQKGAFRAELTRVDFERLWLQRFYENLPRLVRGALNPARLPILFQAEPNRAAMQHCGLDIGRDDLVILGRGSFDFQRMSGDNHWAAMSLAPEDLALASEEITGRAFCPPAETRLLHAAPAAMLRLRALHEATVELVGSGAASRMKKPIAQAIENELVRAMVACLADPSHVESNRRRNARVVARFEEYVSQQCYQPVYIEDVCAAIGVSEWVLRTSCREHLGVNPLRYLWLRRMHLAREQLLRADPGTSTVTEIATNNGFWELGRFAVEYRTLFGESPSGTLRRGRPRRGAMSSPRELISPRS